MANKIDQNGKSYDPSERARKAHETVRMFVEREIALRKYEQGPGTYAGSIQEALNSIGDRLQTCDALEHKEKPK